MKKLGAILALVFISSTALAEGEADGGLGSPGLGLINECLDQAKAAGERFAARYMDIRPVRSGTVTTFEGEVDGVVYFRVETVNKNASRIRTVKVGTVPAQNCRIKSLEALDN